MKRLVLILLCVLITARILQQLSIRTNLKLSNGGKIAPKTQQNQPKLEGSKLVAYACSEQFSSYKDENQTNFQDIGDPIFSNHAMLSDKPFFLKKGLIFRIKSWYCWVISSIDVWKDYLTLLKQGVLGRVTGSFNQVFYSSVSDIVTSLVLGNGSHMRDSISHLFKLTGTQHLMAISGFNLSFLAVLLNSLYGKLLPKSITFWLNLLIISFYTCLVGFSPGLFRAFLMFFLSGLAWKTNRQKMAIYSLFLTAVIAISIDIKVIYSISFQLSYAATLGIIVFTRYINFTSQSQDSMFVDLPRVSTAIWSYLIDSFWLSFAAQIAVFPLVAYQFKEINLIGIVATSLVSWIIPIVLSLAYSFSIFQFLLPLKFLFIFFFPLHYLTSLMFTLLNAVAFKRAIMPLPNFSFWHTVVAYLLISLIYCAFIIIKQQKIIKKHDQIYHFCF